MTGGGNSYRTILRSSSIMGSASVINILSGLVRMKVAAVLLGPAGIGLFGIYQNLVSTAATAAALGFGTVGVRQIADAQENGSAEDVAIARRALFWGTMVLAAVGAMLFYLLRGSIASNLIDDPLRASEIGWLAIGVALTVMAGSQTAFLNGLRRIGDLARIQVASGLAGTVLGIGAIYVWRDWGILILVLVGPATSFILGHWYVSRLGRSRLGRAGLSTIVVHWRTMARLGTAFMLSSLLALLGHLAVRTLVQRELGPAELGHFQAAWMIGMTYLTFVLGAMGTDYYPRLSACIGDRQAACRLINEQTEVALLLAGPVILGMLALAPFVIRLLYTAEFAPAAAILRWQLMGDILKVMSWPCGFALLALGAGRTYFLAESAAVAVFVLGVFLALSAVGIVATGVAFLSMYAAYLPLVLVIMRSRLGFSWTRPVYMQALAILACAVPVLILGHVSELAATGLGLASSLGFGLYGLVRLSTMADLKGKSAWLAALSRKLAMLSGRV